MVQILLFAFWEREKEKEFCQNCWFQRKTYFGTLLAVSETKAKKQMPILNKSEGFML